MIKSRRALVARASIRHRAVKVRVLVPVGLVAVLENVAQGNAGPVNVAREIVPHRRPVVQAVLAIGPRPVVRIGDRAVLVDRA
jgi:hypothetical protein